MEKQLPKNIAEIYEPLRDEVLVLHVKREIYRQLYNSGKEVIKLLNFSAPSFFVMYRDILINDMLMTMRRLTDRGESRSNQNRKERDNLSLKYLVSRFNGAKDSTFRDDLNKLMKKAEETADFARRITNRRIAHNDLRTKLKVDPLSPFYMKMIDEVLHSIENILNKVISHWGHSPVIYEVGGLYNDSNMLINRLRQATWYCQQLEASLADEA
jgi:hypothetical protein